MKSLRRCLMALCALTFAVGVAGCTGSGPADMSPESSAPFSQLNR